MIPEHALDTRRGASIGLVARNRKKSGLDARNRGENRPQQIRLGGVNGDRQGAARRQFENGPAILAERIVRQAALSAVLPTIPRPAS